MNGDTIQQQLRFIRSEIASVQEDTHEIRTRLIRLTSEITGLCRDNAALANQHLSPPKR